MATTVTGAVADTDLGIVAVHEYLAFGLPGWDQDPFVELNRPAGFASMLASLERFRALGGGTVVEVGGSACGRDPDMLERLSTTSGVKIIASTGFGAMDMLPTHFSGADWRPGCDDLAKLMEDELRSGMALSGMLRSKARAGAVVVGAGAGAGLNPVEEDAARAAGIAARASDAPVFVPVEPHGERLVELLTAGGMAAERIVVSHGDDPRALDSGRDQRLAGLGAYISYDHVGWQDGGVAHAMPDARRIEAIKAAVEAGLVERVLLSCSAIGHGLGMPGSAHSLDYLLETFVPSLKQAGIADADIDTMLVRNPARLFGAGGGR